MASDVKLEPIVIVMDRGDRMRHVFRFVGPSARLSSSGFKKTRGLSHQRPCVKDGFIDSGSMVTAH